MLKGLKGFWIFGGEDQDCNILRTVPSLAVPSISILVRHRTSVAVFLTTLHGAGAPGLLLHPLVGGGSDGLPHLPDLAQPDHQRGCKRTFSARLLLPAFLFASEQSELVNNAG